MMGVLSHINSRYDAGSLHITSRAYLDYEGFHIQGEGREPKI